MTFVTTVQTWIMYNVYMAGKFRPDLSEYEIYILSLVDALNKDAVYPMSKTDAVKLAIERACKTILPDVVIKPKRKRYIKLDY